MLRSVFFFFSIPRRFVTSPGSLVRCRDDRNQQHGTTPKTNQPTNDKRTNKTTNEPTTQRTNERTKQTNEHGQRDKQTRTDNKNPATPHTLPIAEAWRGKQKCNALASHKDFGWFFLHQGVSSPVPVYSSEVVTLTHCKFPGFRLGLTPLVA